MKIAVIAYLLLATLPLGAQSFDTAQPTLTLCNGPFALCAASTCKPTGRKYPGTSYPEVVCQCPIVPGYAIADVNAGAMKGTCAPPVKDGKTGIWSLWWPYKEFPQKVGGTWKRQQPATPLSCPAKGGQPEHRLLFGQCFNYACFNQRTVDDAIQIADCFCPGETVRNPKKTTFTTQAGQCNTSVCTEIPVGAGFNLGSFDPCQSASQTP